MLHLSRITPFFLHLLRMPGVAQVKMMHIQNRPLPVNMSASLKDQPAAAVAAQQTDQTALWTLRAEPVPLKQSSKVCGKACNCLQRQNLGEKK